SLNMSFIVRRMLQECLKHSSDLVFTKDELNMVEVEGQNAEGQKIKAALVSLKPSTLPSVCLGGFTITPPAVFRLKAGSGPIHLSGQHLVMMEADQSFEEEDDEEEEEEEVKTSKKRPASSPAAKSQKKMKMDLDDDEEEDDDDDDDSAPSTPAAKQDKTPKGKGAKSPKAQTPKPNLTLPEIKAKIMESVKKGVALPKVQAKFENFMKHGQNVTDAKVISELWKWRQTIKEEK
uniref:Nucleophosmin 1a n=1 Tax=Oryzias sinensis TaxID=183150 RepID=A0A8C7YHE4_9TELE